MTEFPIHCPYCRKPAQLVEGDVIYPHRDDLHEKKFWQCAPCDAYVGCHRPNIGFGDGSRPLGRLANGELRKLKMATHNLFDPIWKSHGITRTRAYRWLSDQLGIPEAHIAEFDEETCRKTIQILQSGCKPPRK